MINTILQATEQFESQQVIVDSPANVPITVFENDTEYYSTPLTESDNTTSDESSDEQAGPDATDATYPDYVSLSYSEVKQSLKEKICIRRESEGAEEIRNLFEPPKKYKLTAEEEAKNAVRKQRNRISANKSRLKRIARETSLEKEAEELEAEHTKLMKEVTVLTKLKRLLTQTYDGHVPTCKQLNKASGDRFDSKKSQEFQSNTDQLIQIINHNNVALRQSNHSDSTQGRDSHIPNISAVKRRVYWSNDPQSKYSRLDRKPNINVIQQDDSIPTVKSEPSVQELDPVSSEAEQLNRFLPLVTDNQVYPTTLNLPTTSNCILTFHSIPATVPTADLVETSGSSNQRNLTNATTAWTKSFTTNYPEHVANMSTFGPHTKCLHSNQAQNGETRITPEDEGLQRVLNDLKLPKSVDMPVGGQPPDYSRLSVTDDRQQARNNISQCNSHKHTIAGINDDPYLTENEKIDKIKLYLLEDL